MAFVVGPALTVTRARAITPQTTCSATPPSRVSRRAMLSGGAAAAAALVASMVSPGVASAKNGEGLEKAFSKVLFPKEGFNAPDSVTPSAVTVDKEVLSSSAAVDALNVIKGCNAKLVDLFSKFKADPQIDLASKVKSVVQISELRNALNVVNEAIDENSQVETDKVVRGIIQDIGELETAAALKPGAKRTSKKIDRTTDWFVKISGDFNRLLSFYN